MLIDTINEIHPMVIKELGFKSFQPLNYKGIHWREEPMITYTPKIDYLKKQREMHAIIR